MTYSFSKEDLQSLISNVKDKIRAVSVRPDLTVEQAEEALQRLKAAQYYLEKELAKAA